MPSHIYCIRFMVLSVFCDRFKGICYPKTTVKIKDKINENVGGHTYFAFNNEKVKRSIK